LYPEYIMAVLFTFASSTLWPPVTLANGAVSIVAANFGVVEKSVDISLPIRT
jgi:hypothetical protein